MAALILPASANDQPAGQDQNNPQADGSAGSASDASKLYRVDRPKNWRFRTPELILPPPRLPKLDRDDGIYLYDIEFVGGNFEYSSRDFSYRRSYRRYDIDSIYDDIKKGLPRAHANKEVIVYRRARSQGYAVLPFFTVQWSACPRPVPVPR